MENLHCNFHSAVYLTHCEKYHKIHSILWKLLGFLPQNYFNYLTVGVLLAFFTFSTLCIKFVFQLTLHIVGQYFQLFWKVYIVISRIENWNCTYHIVEILIVNSLKYLFCISSIKPTDFRRLQQILPQYAKFLPQACSRRSHNTPSLFSSSGSENLFWF